MNKIMVVEFKTVRSNSKEQFQREQKIETSGITSVEFGNQEDYITSVYVDMHDVIDFTGGKVYFNQEVHDCVYARMGDEQMTPNILIKHKDFKRIFEEIKNCKIKTAEEILKSIDNENHPTSI